MFVSSQEPGTIPKCLNNDAGLSWSIHVDSQTCCYIGEGHQLQVYTVYSI